MHVYVIGHLFSVPRSATTANHIRSLKVTGVPHHTDYMVLYCIINSRMWNGNGTIHMYTPHAQGDRCAAQYWTIIYMTLSSIVNSRVWNGNGTSIRSMEFKLCSVS